MTGSMLGPLISGNFCFVLLKCKSCMDELPSSNRDLTRRWNLLTTSVAVTPLLSASVADPPTPSLHSADVPVMRQEAVNNKKRLETNAYFLGWTVFL